MERGESEIFLFWCSGFLCVFMRVFIYFERKGGRGRP